MNTNGITTVDLLCKMLDIDLDAAPITPEEARILNLLEENLTRITNEYVSWLQSEQGAEAMIEAANREKEMFNDLHDDIKQIYRETSGDVNDIIEQVYRQGEAKGYKDIRQTAVYPPASRYALEFLQDYNFNLVKNASDDFVEMLQEEIFTGAMNDMHPYELANHLLNSRFEVPSGMKITPMQRARLIARTETARAQTTGTMQAYANYGVEEVDVVCHDDGRTCTLCLKNKEENPHPLDESTRLVPFHPQCRCGVSAHIKHGDELELQENPIVVNNTPIGEGEEYDNLKTPEDIAKHFGYEYTPNVEVDRSMSLKIKGKFHEFYDRENDCRFYIQTTCGNKNGLIDFKNKGSKNYDMKEIVKYYYQAPKIMKECTTEIIIPNKKRKNFLGVHNMNTKEKLRSGKPNPNYGKSRVVIYKSAFEYTNGEDGNPQFTMYHEMGHSVDLNPKGKNISGLDKWKRLYKEEGYSSDYGLRSLLKDKTLKEDVAETIAMVTFKYINKRNANILVNRGEMIDYETFVKRFPKKVALVEEILGL